MSEPVEQLSIRGGRPTTSRASSRSCRTRIGGTCLGSASAPAPMGADYEALVAAERVWVAETRAGPVGALVLREQEDAMLLENVAVAPSHQGRGIGRALIGFAEDRACEAGLAEITLYTNEQMTENLRLYPALGYTEIDRRRETGFARVFFRKRLS